MRREPPESWPKRLAEGDGDAAELLRKVDRQTRQAPSEPAAWEGTLRRLGRDSSGGRWRVAIAAAAGAVVGAVALYAALSRSPRGHADRVVNLGVAAAGTTSAAAPAAAARAPRSSLPRTASPAPRTAAPGQTAAPVSPAAPAVVAANGAAPGEANEARPPIASLSRTVVEPGPGPSDTPRIQLGRAAVGLPAGRAELLGEAEVTLSRGGRASAFVTSAAATVDLDAGEVELAVQKRAADVGHAFEVTAGVYRFTVLGTKFRVVRANGDVTLSVTEGRVAVARGTERLAVVTAGGFWAGTASPRPARAASDGAPRITAVALREVAAGPRSAPERAAPAGEGPSPRSATRTIGELRTDDARLPLGAAAGSLAPLPFVAPAPATSSTPAAPARLVAAPSPPAAAQAPRPGAHGPQGCGARTPGQVPSRARLACLLDESRGADLAAEVALYEAARIYRDGLGDTDRAIATLRELRRRFPAGALSSEAALSLAELLPRVGRYREALVESAAVLGARPTPARADEIHLMRGDLLRARLGDCRSALNEYAQVAEVTRSSIADPAIFFSAVCLQTLGDRSGARRAFERYLARPAPRHAAEAKRFLGEHEPMAAP